MKSKFTKAIFFIFLFTFFLSPTLAISSTDDFTPTPTRIQVRQEAQTAIQEKKGILTQVRKTPLTEFTIVLEAESLPDIIIFKNLKPELKIVF